MCDWQNENHKNEPQVCDTCTVCEFTSKALNLVHLKQTSRGEWPKPAAEWGTVLNLSSSGLEPIAAERKALSHYNVLDNLC